MTEIAKELLEDVQCGDFVQVRYGTNTDQITVEGHIEKWSENFLYIKKVDGAVAKIRLDDSLRSLEQKKLPLPLSGDESSNSSSNANKEQPAFTRNATGTSTAFRVLRQMVALSPGQTYKFDAFCEINTIKKLVKASSNPGIKKVVGGVIDSLCVAIKNKEVQNKYHNLRAKIIPLWDSCETAIDFDVFYNLLGVMAVVAEDFEYALEPLVRAHKYTLAAYAATTGKLVESAHILSLCALFSGEYNSIDQYISEICVARKDPDALNMLLARHKSDTAICEQIAACAYFLFTESNGKLNRDITPYDSAYEAASQLLNAIPNNWKCLRSATSYWEEYQSYSYPVIASPASNEGEELTGRIYSFNPEQKWGFITPNHYFYITQVFDDSEKGILLRRLLAAGLWDQLEVSFDLGESITRPGNSAANAIELTEEGYDEALSRLQSPQQSSKKRRGYIDSFSPYYQKGWIISGNDKYGFRISNIADPWLKAYYSQCFSPKEQDVTFDLEGKNAVNICWENPQSADREAYASSVSEAEICSWEKFISTQDIEGQTIVIPDEDPYLRLPYVDLPAWVPSTAPHSHVALTWGGKAPLHTEVQLGKQEERVDPVVEKPASVQVDHVAKPVPINEARLLADKASRARVSGDLNQAAELFEAAIQTGSFEEKVLSEYITVLQHLGRIDEALSILNEHEEHISESKLVNLRIGLYDKKKDYVSVCPLYERAFQLAPTASSKSHNLSRLIASYAKIEDYESALRTCKRWEVFYAQNRHSPDSDKLKKASTYISRQKAYCLYFLGQTEEAREIATALVRINPADTVANAILDGTLTSNKVTHDTDPGSNASESSNSNNYGNIEAIDDFWDEETDADKENGQSQFSRFVRMKIQQADIAANLKTKNIRDGKYVGSVEEGLKDVESLVGRQKVSSKTKSDILFSACKLLEQIEQIDEIKSKSTYRKYRFAGRAMAAWGDVMVSQARQLDTTRMAYLYALKVLTPRRNGAEQGWVDSYNRYVKSFFLAQNGSNSLEEYINSQTNRSDRDGANTDIFVDSRLPEVLLPEFTVGMLLLIEAISNQPNRQITFMEELYYKNPELRNSVCRQLECLTDTAIPTDLSKVDFCNYMRNAADKLKEQIGLLNQVLTEMGNVLMRARVSSEVMESLSPGRWRNYLTATDFSRLGKFYYIVKRSQDFYDGSDFENRADCLRAVLLEVNDLLQSIQNEPTDVSYDIFLPALNQISLKVADKQAELYQMFLPRITLEETIAPFRAPDGTIQIQLTVKNGQNYQTADSFQLTNVSGVEVLRYDLPTTLISLRGGEDAEIGLRVNIAQSADNSGSFTATISCCYKCSDAPQNIITKSQDVEFTFVIRSENFQPLTNPFAAYEEKVMESEEMFLGRSTQIDQIMSMIHTPSGDLNYGRAIGMYGQTRSGKSSLLYHLTNRLKQRFDDELLIWDLGNLAKFPKSTAFMHNFMYRLLQLSRESIRKSSLPCLLEEQDSLEAKFAEFRRDRDLAPSIFCEYMDTLNTILKREKKLVVLIADEFTYLHGYINEGSVPKEFMKFWKALLQDYGIFAIIAGQDDMPEFVKEFPNDFGSMELMKLNYLPEEDAKRLIKEPLEAHNDRFGLFRDDGCIDELYNLTAGSAYLTIILCSKLVDYLNLKGAYMITKGIVQDFLRTRALGPKGFLLAKHFEPQIDERGHVEEKHDINFELLLGIARLSQGSGYASLSDITCTDLTQQEIRNHLDRLVDRNVLAKEGREGYWILVKLLEKWLIDTKGA